MRVWICALSAGHQIPLEMELQAVLSCPIWVQTSNSGPLQGQYASLTTELNCLQLQDSICFIYALCCPLRFQLMYWWSHLVIFLSFFIDFKLPIFRETLWFIIKLFVVSVVCGAHCLLALFLLCPLWYSGMSRLILVLIFFFSFLQYPSVCSEVYCSLLCLYICSSPLLFETGVSAELTLPVNSLLCTRGAWSEPVYHRASFSTGCWALISGARDCVAGILPMGS